MFYVHLQPGWFPPKNTTERSRGSRPEVVNTDNPSSMEDEKNDTENGKNRPGRVPPKKNTAKHQQPYTQKLRRREKEERKRKTKEKKDTKTTPIRRKSSWKSCALKSQCQRTGHSPGQSPQHHHQIRRHGREWRTSGQHTAFYRKVALLVSGVGCEIIVG